MNRDDQRKPERLEQILTEKEVIDFFGVNRQQLDRLRYEQGLPFIKITRTLRLFNELSLIDWLTQSEVVLNRTKVLSE